MAHDNERARDKRKKLQQKAGADAPSGMQVVAADRFGMHLDWDAVKTVEHLKFVLRSILIGQYHTDDIRVSDTFVQSLPEEEMATFEEIFIDDRH